MAGFDGWKLVAEWPLHGLSDRQAAFLAEHPPLLAHWAAQHGLTVRSQEAQEVFERGLDALDVDDSRPSPPNPRRHDSEELRAFMGRASRVSGRIRQVYEMCVRDGVSLTECGKRLGISRETVRVHLRRLRALKRESVRRDALRSR